MQMKHIQDIIFQSGSGIKLPLKTLPFIFMPENTVNICADAL